jgi:hypothetical protein
MQGYMKQHNRTWREDASNASPKYLRNRVRNELIPLLQDLMGDADALDKRLLHWEEQSELITMDLQPRVNQYLDRVLLENGRLFSLEEARNISPSPSMLLQSQALYQWISSRLAPRMDNEEDPNISNQNFLSYDQLQRIMTQLQVYPNNRQWTLEIGSNWNLVRTGDVLSVVTHDMTSKSSSQDEDMSELAAKDVAWSIWKDGFPSDNEDSFLVVSRLFITVPALMVTSHLHFCLSTVGEWPTTLTFVPSWRSGRSSSKVRQFLRGQDVPLHLRDVTSVVILKDATSSSSQESRLVAVQVHDEWMVHADFYAIDSNKDDQVILRLEIP